MLILFFSIFPYQLLLSQNIDSGILAYNQGDYAIALENFMPLADIDTDYTQLRISENNPIITPLAQYYLFLMYCHGRGVDRDRVKAIEWLNKSRRGGNASAERANCK